MDKNYELVKYNGKYSLIVWINKESYIYLKKDITLGELLDFKDSISGKIDTFVKGNLS